ncbi:MAG: TRASH domain-containing protein [Thermoplasmataceae archaeon]
MINDRTEIDQRLISILKSNSRTPISDIADELGISRVTAKRRIDALVDSGVISGFTLKLSIEEENLAMVHFEKGVELPKDLLLEDYELMDGSHMSVLHYEDIPKIGDLEIRDMKIVKKRSFFDSNIRLSHVHCDYCGKLITDSPIRVKLNNHTYYACCANCEGSIRKRVSRLEEAKIE